MRRRELLAAGMTGLAGTVMPKQATTSNSTASHLEVLLLPRSLPSVQPRSLQQLMTMRQVAGSEFQACHYERVGELLPQLIAAAQSSHESTRGRGRELLTSLISDAYVLTSELAIKLNEDSMAWVAADRAIAAAGRSGDPISKATASRSVAIALRRTGHHESAVKLLTDTALGLIADSQHRDPTVLATYGALLCTAAYTAAQNGKRATALDLITEAQQAASRLGEAAPAGMAFSANNVSIYQIGVHHTLGESGQALTAASTVNQHLLPNTERHSRFCIDTARAWAQHDRPDRAYEALLAVERYAPEEIRRPSVQALISTLLYSPKPKPSGLRALATRAGATD